MSRFSELALLAPNPATFARDLATHLIAASSSIASAIGNGHAPLLVFIAAPAIGGEAPRCTCAADFAAAKSGSKRYNLVVSSPALDAVLGNTLHVTGTRTGALRELTGNRKTGRCPDCGSLAAALTVAVVNAHMPGLAALVAPYKARHNASKLRLRTAAVDPVGLAPLLVAVAVAVAAAAAPALVPVPADDDLSELFAEAPRDSDDVRASPALSQESMRLATAPSLNDYSAVSQSYTPVSPAYMPATPAYADEARTPLYDLGERVAPAVGEREEILHTTPLYREQEKDAEEEDAPPTTPRNMYPLEGDERGEKEEAPVLIERREALPLGGCVVSLKKYRRGDAVDVRSTAEISACDLPTMMQLLVNPIGSQSPAEARIIGGSASDSFYGAHKNITRATVSKHGFFVQKKPFAAAVGPVMDSATVCIAFGSDPVGANNACSANLLVLYSAAPGPPVPIHVRRLDDPSAPVTIEMEGPAHSVLRAAHGSGCFYLKRFQFVLLRVAYPVRFDIPAADSVFAYGYAASLSTAAFKLNKQAHESGQVLLLTGKELRQKRAGTLALLSPPRSPPHAVDTAHETALLAVLTDGSGIDADAFAAETLLREDAIETVVNDTNWTLHLQCARADVVPLRLYRRPDGAPTVLVSDAVEAIIVAVVGDDASEPPRFRLLRSYMHRPELLAYRLQRKSIKKQFEQARQYNNQADMLVFTHALAALADKMLGPELSDIDIARDFSIARPILLTAAGDHQRLKRSADDDAFSSIRDDGDDDGDASDAMTWGTQVRAHAVKRPRLSDSPIVRFY